MRSQTEIPMLDLQTGLWKARAQAKQKWLERSLAEAASFIRQCFSANAEATSAGVPVGSRP